MGCRAPRGLLQSSRRPSGEGGGVGGDGPLVYIQYNIPVHTEYSVKMHVVCACTGGGGSGGWLGGRDLGRAGGGARPRARPEAAGMRGVLLLLSLEGVGAHYVLLCVTVYDTRSLL